MKKKKRDFEVDYLKAVLKANRETMGFEPLKIFKNKKKYTRKIKHKKHE